MWLQTGEERQWLRIEHRRIEDMARRNRGSATSASASARALTDCVRSLLARLGPGGTRTQRARPRPATR